MATNTTEGQVRTAKAVARHVRVTPQKARRIVDLIRGQRASAAVTTLKFAPQSASEPVLKVLESAIANAENNHDLDVDELVVAQAHVGKALVIKRFHPRGRGRMGRIFKPFANLTIVVREGLSATSTAEAS